MGNKDQRRQQQQPSDTQNPRGQNTSFAAVDESPYQRVSGDTQDQGDNGAGVDTAEQTGEATGEAREGVQGQADAAPQELTNEGQPEAEVDKRSEGLQALAEMPKTDNDLVQQAVAAGRAVIEQSVLMKSLIPTLEAYQEVMDPNKSVSTEQVRDQQLALFRLIRDVVRSEDDFGDGIHLLISAFADPAMTSLKAPWIHRGFDDALVHLPVATQRLARSFFTLLDVAGSVQDPRSVYKLIDLSACLNREGLTEQMRHRLVSYFSA